MSSDGASIFAALASGRRASGETMRSLGAAKIRAPPSAYVSGQFSALAGLVGAGGFRRNQALGDERRDDPRRILANARGAPASEPASDAVAFFSDPPPKTPRLSHATNEAGAGRAEERLFGLAKARGRDASKPGTCRTAPSLKASPSRARRNRSLFRYSFRSSPSGSSANISMPKRGRKAPVDR